MSQNINFRYSTSLVADVRAFVDSLRETLQQEVSVLRDCFGSGEEVYMNQLRLINFMSDLIKQFCNFLDEYSKYSESEE